jgi:acyl carrier protein
MNHAEVVSVLLDVLTSIQQNSGRDIASISGNTCPIGDLDGFDSLNGVEATVELADRLGVEISGTSVFVNESGTKALTVTEVAERLTAAHACAGKPK